MIKRYTQFLINSKEFSLIRSLIDVKSFDKILCTRRLVSDVGGSGVTLYFHKD